MRMIALYAAAAGLAACGPAETQPQPAAPPDTEAETGSLAADGKPTPGNYRITDPQGAVSTEVLAPDGTFTSTDADGKVESGRWVQKSPDTFCITMDTEGVEEECFSESVDANGVWTSTDSEGNSSTVERIED